MNIRQLEYLCALDRERHFGRAADTCHVTQPTLSAGLRALEEALGVRLVHRARRFDGFTPEGERALRWAHRIVADCGHLEAEVERVRGELVGVLRIGAIPTALPATALLTSPFLERHPHMRAEVRSMTSREIARGLATFRLDVGLTYLEGEPIASVRSRRLYRERYLLLTPADGPFARRDTVRWRELNGMPLCLLTPDMQNRRIIDRLVGAGAAVPAPPIETDSLSTLISHVRQGWSSVMAHPWLATFGLPADMRALPLQEPVAHNAVGLIWPDDDPVSPLVSALDDLVETLDIAGELDSRASALGAL